MFCLDIFMQDIINHQCVVVASIEQIQIRTIHLELNLMNHSNLRISRALDLTEGGCNLIFALGFKTRPRKTRDGNRTIAFMIPLCREALSVQFRPTVSN